MNLGSLLYQHRSLPDLSKSSSRDKNGFHKISLFKPVLLLLNKQVYCFIVLVCLKNSVGVSLPPSNLRGIHQYSGSLWLFCTTCLRHLQNMGIKNVKCIVCPLLGAFKASLRHVSFWLVRPVMFPSMC